ncbi:MAG TPA: type I restriction-modification system subunit M N-terminal domain-containing protein [candidate division Zixibacteria bacterium]|nr:type I restriction-modification system subunit M N-terminal domain-containing protein [candidate division Zixibacteria bacterium]
MSKDFKEELWDTADKLRANSSLKYSEFAKPVLGIVFLRYADFKFVKIEQELQKEEKDPTRRRKISETDYIERGAIYLPEKARYSYLLNLPEAENIGLALNEAMKVVEEYNEDLRGILDIDYQKIRKDTLIALLNQMSTMEFYTREDVFGEIVPVIGTHLGPGTIGYV